MWAETRTKRSIDIILSLIAMVISSPVFGFIALAIKLDSPGPVIFKQQRMGKDEKIFTLYKFRTMQTGTPDVATHLLEDPENRITRVGKFLRHASLDELPQLWNVIRGDMSFVGPRPALFNQDDLISGRREKEINKLKPGITGWAQINGRDELPIDTKIFFDHYYLEHQSFMLDLKILLSTPTKVVSGEGISEGKKEVEVG